MLSKYIKYLRKFTSTISYSIFISSGFPKYNNFLFLKQYKKPEHNIDDKKLSHYLTFMPLIKGCIFKEAAQLFIWIDYIQKKENITGNLFEIGTYQGKSAIVMGLMTEPDKEILYICDPFEIKRDYDNGDRKSSFINNFNSFFNSTKFLQTYYKPSEKLILDECKQCRFFHIDGNHSPEQTYNDLHTAANSIIEKGIVVVDDIFNFLCPGVTEGIYRFLSDNKSLLPVAIGFNKLLLSKPQKQKWYQEKLFSNDWKKYISEPGLAITEIEMLNHKVPIWYKDSFPVHNNY